MKSISSSLATHFGKDTTTLAVLWKVVRQDGTTFGFTTHDKDISYPSATGNPVNDNCYFGRYVGGTTHGVIVGDITTQNAGFAGDLALLSLTDGSQLAFVPALLNPTNFYTGTFDVTMSAFRDNKTFAPHNTNLAIPADVPQGATSATSQEGGIVNIVDPNSLTVVNSYNLTELARTTVTTQGSMYTFRGAWNSSTNYAVGDIVTDTNGVKYLALTTTGPTDPMGVGVLNPLPAGGGGNPTNPQATTWAGIPSFHQHVSGASQTPCYTPLANIAYNQSLNTIVSTQEFVGGILMLHTLGGTPQSYILQDRAKALVLSIDLQNGASPVPNGTLTFFSGLDNSVLATISVTNPASEKVLTVAAFVDQNLVDSSGNGIWLSQDVYATYSVGGVTVDGFAEVDTLYDSFNGLAGQWTIVPDIDGHSVWVVSYVFDMQSIQKYDLNTKTLTASWFWPFNGSFGFSKMAGFEDGSAFFFQDSVGNIYAWSTTGFSLGNPTRLHKIDPSTFTEVAALGFDSQHPTTGYPQANNIFLSGNYSDWCLYQRGGKDYLAYNGGTPSAGGQFVGVINLTDMILVGTFDVITIGVGSSYTSKFVFVDKNGDVWWGATKSTETDLYLLKWHPADGTSGTGTDGNPKLVVNKIFEIDGTLFQGVAAGGGITYQAETGMSNTAKASKSDLSVDNLEVVAFLDSSSIDEHDLRAGLYDYATVEVRIVNWADPSMGDLKVLSGTLGEVKMRNGAFTAEVRGLTQYLTTQIVSLYGPLCRAELFSGPESGIDVNSSWLCHLRNTDYQQTSSVVSSPNAVTIIPNSGLVTTAPGGGSTTTSFSVVNHIKGFNAKGISTLSLTLPGSVTSGNKILLSFDAFDFTANNPTITITDNHSGTYVRVNHANNGEHDSFIYYNNAPAAGATTITISITNHHSNSFIVGVAAEVSGLQSPIALDGNNTNTAPSATGSFNTGNVTTTNADDIIITGIYSPDATAPVGYTVIDRASFTTAQGGFSGVGNIGWSMAFLKATSVGAESPIWSTTVLHGIFGNTAAFKLAQVAVPPAASGSGWFNDGMVIFTSGVLNGYKFEVKHGDATSITLFLPMPAQPAPGDTFKIEPGCNKTIQDCQQKFNNIKNHRGDPFIPSNDLILLYPDART